MPLVLHPLVKKAEKEHVCVHDFSLATIDKGAIRAEVTLVSIFLIQHVLLEAEWGVLPFLRGRHHRLC
jgi:hypothetical protein